MSGHAQTKRPWSTKPWLLVPAIIAALVLGLVAEAYDVQRSVVFIAGGLIVGLVVIGVLIANQLSRPASTTLSPGWYYCPTDVTGTVRWWDGQQWTASIRWA